MDVIKNYKCPCCDAPLRFDGPTQELSCDSCGNKFPLEVMEQMSDAEEQAKKDSSYNWDKYEPRNFGSDENINISGYNCPSCGAQITGDDTLGATVCPYCGNATIIKAQFEGGLKPDYIIPFRLDKKAAMNAFEEACKKAPFLPDEFKNKRKIEEMAGIYVPFWMFDCDCNAAISYRAYKTIFWSDSRYNYTKTDYYKLFRKGSIGFSNIPVDGSKKADDTYMEAIEPFDYKDAVEFENAYLSGYLADKYDVSSEESIARANERVKNSTVSEFSKTTGGYLGVYPENTSVSFSNGKIRYSLLPVWMLNIRYGDKNYKYAINGQTGKTVGEYPADKKKKWKYFLKIAGICYGIAAVAALILL